MAHKLEVAFVQGTAPVSKIISRFSKHLADDNYKCKFKPSHVFLMLDDTIIFESSTYKRAGDNDEKVMEKGTRLLLLEDIDDRIEESLIKRTIISKNCDPYLALRYAARASNYHYSYKSIFKFLCKGHLRKDTGRPKDEYICSGLVLDALREQVFLPDKSVQYIINKFKDIDSNSVTPLDLFIAFTEAGYNFRTSKGLPNVSNL